MTHLAYPRCTPREGIDGDVSLGGCSIGAVGARRCIPYHNFLAPPPSLYCTAHCRTTALPPLSLRSELLQQSNRNARRVNAFRAKMQSVERWMQGQGLPSRLRRRIKTFYAEVRWWAGGGWPGQQVAVHLVRPIAGSCHPAAI